MFRFYPLPMLGGFLWSTGNLNTVIIIKLIGIGLGSLVWVSRFNLIIYFNQIIFFYLKNTILLVFGWAIARFGNF